MEIQRRKIINLFGGLGINFDLIFIINLENRDNNKPHITCSYMKGWNVLTM